MSAENVTMPKLAPTSFYDSPFFSSGESAVSTQEINIFLLFMKIK